MWRPNHRQVCIFLCAAIVLSGTAITTSAQAPNNAALLYYQAFLMYEAPEGTMSNMLDDFRQGRIPANDDITAYIRKNQRVIDTVVKAADLDTCDWGYDYSLGAELSMPNLAKMRQIAFLLAAEARWHASQGDYQTALEHCLALRKMGVHVCDKILVSYLVGVAIDALASGVTEDLLGPSMLGAKALSQLRSDTVRIAAQLPTASIALEHESQVCVMTMTRDQMQTQIQLAREMGDDLGSEELVKRLEQGDDAFYDRNREFYLSMIDKITFVLDANMPYSQTCDALDDLSARLAEEMKDNPDATFASLALDPDSVKRIYLLSIRRQTNVNALLTAMDLLVARAQTGQLPTSLPATCPPDLYSGKPFTYTKTAEGFTLRCQVQESENKKPCEYEFKINQ